MPPERAASGRGCSGRCAASGPATTGEPRRHPGIGKVGPGIFAAVAPGSEVRVIGRRLLVVEPVGTFGPQAIVPDPDVEAAFGLACADDAVRGEAEPCHPLGIRRHVGLADQPGVHSRRAQMIAQRRLPHPQREPVPLHPVRRCIAPGVETHPAGPANRGLAEGVGESDALCGDPVEVRGMQMRVAGAGQIVEAQLVIHDKQDVHRGSPGREIRRCRVRLGGLHPTHKLRTQSGCARRPFRTAHGSAGPQLRTRLDAGSAKP